MLRVVPKSNEKFVIKCNSVPYSKVLSQVLKTFYGGRKFGVKDSFSKFVFLENKMSEPKQKVRFSKR